ncbi:MAG: hypothetical protein R3A52_12250 [Polyangiales bacterium]
MRPALRLSLAALLAAVGCGPNYRYVYDGEGAFERCYALDFDVDIAPAARSECWANWLQAYAYGSTSDRVEYARGRLASISRQTDSGAVATPPAAPHAPTAPADEPVVNRAAPAILTPDAGDAPLRSNVMVSTFDAVLPRATRRRRRWSPPATALAQGAIGEPPGARCGDDCRTQWSGCGERCTARDAACVAQCDERYRECMRGCF